MQLTKEQHDVLEMLFHKLRQDDEKYRTQYGSYRNGAAIEIIDEISKDNKIESKSKSKFLSKESAESLIKGMHLNLEKIEYIKQDIKNTIHYLDQFT